MALAPEQRKQLGDASEVVASCDKLEVEIAELRAAYEQFFLGIERRPPVDRHKALTAAVQKLRTTFVRQTGARFRIQAIQQKFTTYERLWARTLQEIENGTYVRDLRRARRRSATQGAAPEAAKAKRAADDDFSIDEAEPEQAAAPARPATAAPRVPAPAAGSGAGPVSDDKLRAVYDAFVKAKKRCNEDVSKMSYDQVAQSLRKQVPELMKRHNAKAVEFKVVIKDGKAVLRAVPRE